MLQIWQWSNPGQSTLEYDESEQVDTHNAFGALSANMSFSESVIPYLKTDRPAARSLHQAQLRADVDVGWFISLVAVSGVVLPTGADTSKCTATRAASTTATAKGRCDYCFALS
jgi:hypothetical protein